MYRNEHKRVEAVNRFLTLEISKEEEIQRIVDMAAVICKTKVALVTLLDHDTQHIRFKFGSDLVQTSRSVAFCNYAIEQKETFVVNDAFLDARFVKNPLVTGDPNIRFYAGSNLTTQDGYHLGSLCVLDDVPKELSGEQQQMLELLSKQIIHIMEFDSSIKFLKEQFLQAKSSEDKLRSFFESSSSCHLLLGEDLKVIAYNRALSTFINKIGRDKIEVGSQILAHVHLSYKEEYIACHKLAMEGQSTYIEKRLNYENETVHWYMSFEPARNSGGEIIGVSYNATDITQRVAQEQMVLEQNQALKRIAFIQSHELRRPVSSILGFMNLFKYNNYLADKEDLMMMEKAVVELDLKVREIVSSAV